MSSSSSSPVSVLESLEMNGKKPPRNDISRDSVEAGKGVVVEDGGGVGALNFPVCKI